MNTMPSLSASNALTFENLDSYLNTIQHFPILSENEEISLFQRFQLDNDLNAAREIILSHLKFVVYIAKSYRGYGLPLSDLIQEGNIGLMKSVKRFDLSKGVRLATFAIHWIRAEIHEFVLKNWKLVKVATTKAQRKLFFNLRKHKKGLNRLSNEEVNTLADQLNVKSEDIVKMDARLQQHDLHFDPAYGDKNNEGVDFIANANLLEDHSTRPDMIVEQDRTYSKSLTALDQALINLDDRSRDIVTSRWLKEEKMSLKTLAQKYEVSIERIRQLESNALLKLRELMPAELAPVQ